MNTLEFIKVLLIISYYLGLGFLIIVVLPIAIWSFFETIFGK